MRLGVAAVLGVGLALGTSVTAAPLSYPPDGHRAAGDRAWLVVEGLKAPAVTVDGRAVAGTDYRGAYHVRLEGLRSRGSTVTLAGGRSLTVFGLAESPTGFHQAAPPRCWACHDASPSGCVGCHRWPGAKHAELLAKGCTGCHPPEDRRPRAVAPLCAPCHPEHARGKHPKLRHAIKAPRDPQRPSRALDCASCHDPHAPECLSCLGKPALRQWCKGCHGGG